jgi:uncharacterized protein with PQ loop repeat
MSGRSLKHATLHKKAARKRDIMDYLAYFFTFATPLFELPQAIEIYTAHSAQDVSLWTWGFFCIDNIVWIVYAWRRQLRPLLINSLLFEAIEVSILIGILLYR